MPSWFLMSGPCATLVATQQFCSGCQKIVAITLKENARANQKFEMLEKVSTKNKRAYERRDNVLES